MATIDGQQFKDRLGNSYDVDKVSILSRMGETSSVMIDVDGSTVMVEITPTEALRIIELSD